MGRRCAWCEVLLPPKGGAVWSRASELICCGCFEELEVALARTGLRFGPKASEGGRAAPLISSTAGVPSPPIR